VIPFAQQTPNPKTAAVSRFAIASACLLLTIIGISTSGCARYHIGNQFLFRSDIRTVAVPIFETDSFRRFLGQRLTEAVVKDIELYTPLTIADPAIADSFLRGRIIEERKSVAGENENDEPRSLQLGWQVEVDWVDRAGVPLMQRQSLRIYRDAWFIPEGGQSLSTAQQKAIDLIARDIIGQMEMPSL
jgi:hypothetical protein